MTTTMSAPQPLDPWLSMWTRPRATVRQILDTDPNRGVLLLAVLSGILSSFSSAAGGSVGDLVPLPIIIVACVVIGAVSGLIGLFISGAVLAWVGRQLGGNGDARSVRTAIAWATVPTIWTGTLLIPELILFGQELFSSTAPRIAANPILALTLLLFGLVEIFVGIWAFVVFLHSLGEAHGFSAWRALGTLILASLFMAIPLICAIVGIGVLTLLGGRV